MSKINSKQKGKVGPMEFCLDKLLEIYNKNFPNFSGLFYVENGEYFVLNERKRFYSCREAVITGFPMNDHMEVKSREVIVDSWAEKEIFHVGEEMEKILVSQGVWIKTIVEASPDSFLSFTGFKNTRYGFFNLSLPTFEIKKYFLAEEGSKVYISPRDHSEYSDYICLDRAEVFILPMPRQKKYDKFIYIEENKND